MDAAKKRFLHELGEEIGDHPDREQILTDYQLHIQELLKDPSYKNSHEEDTYQYLVRRLGSPREIAKLWRKEFNTSPHKTQWLFVICNIFIFLGGTSIILSYHFFQWTWLSKIWYLLTDLPFLIIFIYLLFWGLLGYEIGKEFGHRGKQLLRRTFFISLIPNVIVLYLIVFRIIPYEWFEPVLQLPLIVVCILFTVFLYPIGYVGYRWGRKASI